MNSLVRAIRKWTPFVVMLAGSIVMFGWIFGIETVKSILPIWVSMKFSTAFCFVLSGLTLYFVSDEKRVQSNAAQIILPILSFGILFIMSLFLVSSFTGISSGLEDIFIKEPFGTMHTLVPGRPSIGTMLCFTVIAMEGMFTVYGVSNIRLWSRVAGSSMLFICCSSIVGYIFDQPLLSFGIEHFSTRMAFHTTILFMLSGLCMFFIERKTGEK